MENFKKQYRDLETKVMRQLRDKIEASNYTSKHINEKAIKVNVFDYTELAVINDRLTFMDDNGFQYSLFTDTGLEDLIDIIAATTDKECYCSLCEKHYKNNERFAIHMRKAKHFV